jgi:hypothetical protein
MLWLPPPRMDRASDDLAYPRCSQGGRNSGISFARVKETSPSLRRLVWTRPGTRPCVEKSRAVRDEVLSFRTYDAGDGALQIPTTESETA